MVIGSAINYLIPYRTECDLLKRQIAVSDGVKENSKEQDQLGLVQIQYCILCQKYPEPARQNSVFRLKVKEILITISNGLIRSKDTNGRQKLDFNYARM